MAVNFNVMDLGKTGLLTPERMGYKDSLEIIQDESLKVQKSFVKIGWYLKHIRDNELYKEDGYANIYECASARLGYSQSTTSRFIKICEKFSKDHNSPELDEKYAGFDKSQMIEMLPMEPEEIENHVTPDMTVAEIRGVKNEKTVNKPDDGEIRLFCRHFLYDISGEDRSELKEYMFRKYGKEHARGVASGNAGNMEQYKVSYQCSPKGISINGSDEITWSCFAKRVSELEQLMPGACFSIAEDADEKENELPGQTSIEKDFPEYLPEPVTANPCETDFEGEQVFKENLVTLQDSALAEPDEEGKQPENTQPELPLLRNDDQRIKWLENYQAWGLWYRDENIDVNYYKYDFPDGSRLIAEEYPQRESHYYGYNGEFRDECFYHLLEKNRKEYDRTYDEVYRHNPDSATYLIGFLKNIQKAYQ